MGESIRIVIVGAPGYTGAELAGLLASHPGAEVVGLFGSDRRGADGATERMSDLHPQTRFPAQGALARHLQPVPYLFRQKLQHRALRPPLKVCVADWPNQGNGKA